MKTMKHLILILIIVLSFINKGFSQNDKLIPEALVIKTAFDKLQHDPKSAELQKRYIDLFPDNSMIFKKIFCSPTFDQLYHNSYLYIDELKDLWDFYPDVIGFKLIRLCIGFKKWDVDAIGNIQSLTVDYANSHIDLFITKIKQLDNKEQNTLITFLADVENHSAYKIYQSLIDNLKNKNESDLVSRFEKAREKRKSEKHN